MNRSGLSEMTTRNSYDGFRDQLPENLNVLARIVQLDEEAFEKSCSGYVAGAIVESRACGCNFSHNICKHSWGCTRAGYSWIAASNGRGPTSTRSICISKGSSAEPWRSRGSSETSGPSLEDVPQRRCTNTGGSFPSDFCHPIDSKFWQTRIIIYSF